MITDGDCGGGCFIDDSLVGFALGCVEGQSCVLASIADYADFIRSNVGGRAVLAGRGRAVSSPRAPSP